MSMKPNWPQHEFIRSKLDLSYKKVIIIKRKQILLFKTKSPKVVPDKFKSQPKAEDEKVKTVGDPCHV